MAIIDSRVLIERLPFVLALHPVVKQVDDRALGGDARHCSHHKLGKEKMGIRVICIIGAPETVFVRVGVQIDNASAGCQCHAAAVQHCYSDGLRIVAQGQGTAAVRRISSRCFAQVQIFRFAADSCGNVVGSVRLFLELPQRRGTDDLIAAVQGSTLGGKPAYAVDGGDISCQRVIAAVSGPVEDDKGLSVQFEVFRSLLDPDVELLEIACAACVALKTALIALSAEQVDIIRGSSIAACADLRQAVRDLHSKGRGLVLRRRGFQCLSTQNQIISIAADIIGISAISILFKGPEGIRRQIR